MGYIGNQQTEGYSQVPPKQDLTGATGTSLTLTHAVASAEGIDLFINNVRQEPTEAYSVGGDGVTVTLTGSVVATDDIYVVYNSLARQTSTHPSNQALQATSGTFSGAVSAASATVTGDLTVDTNTLYVDSTNNRVGINEASPTSDLTFGSNSTIEMVGGSSKLLFKRADTSTIGGNPLGAIEFSHTDTDDAGTAAKIIGEGDGSSGEGRLAFHTGTPTALSERLRIDSNGNVALNGSVRDSSRFTINGNVSNPNLQSWQNTTSGVTHFWFRNPNGIVGSIVTSGSSTAYNTSSDYRLKTAVNYDWDATTRLKQLKPARFEWIADGDDAVPVDGFLAHEVQDIVPEAISGTKDAMRDEEYEVTPAVLDEDGNEVTPAVMGTRSVPDYQGIDQSKLVPLLVKTIQELETRIAALEAS